MLNFRVRVQLGNCSNRWSGNFNNLVGHVCQLGEIGGGVSRGKDHSDVRWKPLQEQLFEEGVVVRCRSEVISEELLHPTEELCRLSVA